MNKKVLFISYFFPPMAGASVIRVIKFVKFLPFFGWQTVVLTTKNGYYPLEDQTYLRDIPKEVKVYRAGYIEPALWIQNRFWQSFLNYLIYPIFLIPDRQMLWFLPALISGYKIIKREKIKVIFTSSAPLSGHLVALVLKKLTGVKWVADFRDEWMNNPAFKFPTPLHRWLGYFFERKVIKNSDKVTAALPRLTQYFNKIEPAKQKYFGITNGFDPDDFKNSPWSYHGKTFQILHSGSLYGEGRQHAQNFRMAFEKLKLKNAKLVFLGEDKWVSHKKALQIMNQSTILLIVLRPDPTDAHIPGKFFEYLAARKPILTITPYKTHVAQLTQDLKVGEVVDPKDQLGIQKAILKMYNSWQKNTLSIPQINLEPFNRKKLTGELAKLFNEIESN